MENLEIISTQFTVHAKRVINGNTANFTWSNVQDQMPEVINFNVSRGVAGEPTFTGNHAITGAYYASGKFDIQNNNFKAGDFELYAGIHETLLEIIELEQPEA